MNLADCTDSWEFDMKETLTRTEPGMLGPTLIWAFWGDLGGIIRQQYALYGQNELIWTNLPVTQDLLRGIAFC